MVVVGNARDRIGSRAEAEITSVLPSAGGKMVFARVSGNTQSPFQVDLEICVYSRRGVDHNDTSQHGAVAQLIERVVRNDEVVGLIPICSTIFCLNIGRARWGDSGALYPQSAIAGLNSHPEASSLQLDW